MTTMRVVGECFFWYRLTRVFPDKFHRAVKQLCCVCDSSISVQPETCNMAANNELTDQRRMPVELTCIWKCKKPFMLHHMSPKNTHT